MEEAQLQGGVGQGGRQDLQCAGGVIAQPTVPSDFVQLRGTQVQFDRTTLIPKPFASSVFDVLPLPYVFVLDRLPNFNSKSRRVAKRFSIRRDSLLRLNKCIFTLNSLFCSNVDFRLIEPPCPSDRQRQLISALYDKCNWVAVFLCQPIPPGVGDQSGADHAIALHAAGILNNVENRANFVPHHEECHSVRVDLLSLPGVGEGAVVDILGLLPSNIREMYQTGAQILKPQPPSHSELAKIRVAHRVSAEQYPVLIDRLVSCGMVRLCPAKPKCINGFFAVPKDETSQRLIFDARRANKYFIESPSVTLVTLSMLADLSIDESASLFIGKSDVRNMYHRFRVPEWMLPFFGLPQVEITDANGNRHHYWPCVVSLPMGFSHAVYLAHNAHLEVIQNSLCWPIPLLQGARDFTLGSVFFSYIDDHVVLSTELETAKNHLDASVNALNGKGLHHHPSKYLDPTLADEAEVLGAFLSREGMLGPSRKRLRMVEEATKQFLKSRCASPRSFSKLIGVWVWLLLLNRSLLSVLSSAVYRFIALDTTTVLPIPNEVLHDLDLLLGVSPFLFLDMHMSKASTIFATDASMEGGAMVSSTVEVDQFDQLAVERENSGWFEFPMQNQQRTTPQSVQQFIHCSDWRTVLRCRWKFPGDQIYRLEAHALFLALRNIALKRIDLEDSRVIFMLDSSSVVGAVAKGRSSTDSMNHMCRRVASLICLTGIRPFWLWIGTDDNPADGPSRNWKD
jgi:hypothetical protein